MAVGTTTAVVGMLASVVLGRSWWDGGDASVPRDGHSHVVHLDDPGEAYAIWSDRSLVDPTCRLDDQTGSQVPLTEVPPGERAYVDTVAVAEPEASFLFTAPVSGSVTVTCDAVDATPVQTLDLGPAPNHVLVGLRNWGPALPGAFLFLLGMAIGLSTLVAAVVGRVRHGRTDRGMCG
ncbi:hypothetical protein GCM10023339_39900 [Alloalcanivorax gelatiniphagus]